MDEESIRAKIREKLSSKKLSPDLWPQNPRMSQLDSGGKPPESLMRSTQPGEICAACDVELVAYTDCPTEAFRAQDHDRLFVFHAQCGDLYEDEVQSFYEDEAHGFRNYTRWSHTRRPWRHIVLGLFARIGRRIHKE